MFNNIKKNFVGYINKSVDGIVDDFEFVGHELKLMIVDKNKDF